MARRDEVVKLRETGLTYAEIGRRFGITKQRVWQILKGRPTPEKPDLQSRVMLQKEILLRTRVFELYNDKYTNIYELARAMRISLSQVYRVREGKRGINEKFITGVAKAFPGYKLDELFYIVKEAEID